MIGKALVLLLATTQIAFAQEKRIEGAFGVLFNTDVVLVTGRLEGRYTRADKFLAKQSNKPISFYTITPPNPSKYLKGYRVVLDERTQKVYLICGFANITSADRDGGSYISVSKNDALTLYDAYDKALTNKYGEGRNIDARQSGSKSKRFSESENQFIVLEYENKKTLGSERNDFDISVCYFDLAIRRGDIMGPSALPDVIDIDDSSL